MSIDTQSETTDYPLFAIEHIQNPNRLWAFPVIGGTIKTLIILTCGGLAYNRRAMLPAYLKHHQFARGALYGQVLGTGLYRRVGLHAAFNQGQLFLPGADRFLPWVLTRLW